MKHALFLVAVAACIALTVAPAQAGWMMTHGSDAVLQNPGAASTIWMMGWGLDMTLNASSGTWVHFPVPTPANRTKGARYVRFQLGTEADAWISEIHVRNGSDATSYEATGTWQGAYNRIVIDMGDTFNFNNGMVISLYALAGSGPSRRLILGGAGARFVKMP